MTHSMSLMHMSSIISSGTAHNHNTELALASTDAQSRSLSSLLVPRSSFLCPRSSPVPYRRTLSLNGRKYDLVGLNSLLVHTGAQQDRPRQVLLTPCFRWIKSPLFEPSGCVCFLCCSPVHSRASSLRQPPFPGTPSPPPPTASTRTSGPASERAALGAILRPQGRLPPPHPHRPQ